MSVSVSLSSLLLHICLQTGPHVDIISILLSSTLWLLIKGLIECRYFSDPPLRIKICLKIDPKITHFFQTQTYTQHANFQPNKICWTPPSWPHSSRLDDTVHWINSYLVDKCRQNKPHYLLKPYMPHLLDVRHLQVYGNITNGA